MSIYADQKRANLRQVSADAEELTRKRLAEGVPPEAPAPERSEKEIREEAKQRAETVVKEEKGQTKASIAGK